jgi:UDP-N-acetyl-D-galactosamine dehydrogenase
MREKVVIVGLGYVGLPLAVALSKNQEHYVVGFDIDIQRIEELKQGNDRTFEISASALRSADILFTTTKEHIAKALIYIITVPTPVDKNNNPDLTALKEASKLVGEALAPGSIVIFESTVYPGITEDFCGAILEQYSGLKAGTDFFLGYSPERINPGDKVHTVDKITKVVAGQNPEVTQKLTDLYGSINNGNIFVASSIRVAEASKVIENTQRDINIAFINEITMIFHKIGISVYEVLEAAQTKWNFLPFQPGLVGGHCIGVDPFYLAACARNVGHNPEIILAGRRINDYMGIFVADEINRLLEPAYGVCKNILILGMTFKENVPDLRNTKVVDLVNRLQSHGHSVVVHDPYANPQEAKAFYGIELSPHLDELGQYDCLVGAVAHDVYRTLHPVKINNLLADSGVVVDLKGIWPEMRDVKLWRL